ncbi:MAG: tRNA guanosine(34) transglycosylase Tgt [Acidimicrobiales bacterium]
MFVPEATSGQARTGRVETARGGFATPCFMPVGSRGVVRLLSASDMGQLGAEVLLANAYHLMLRPGAEVVAELGGLHGFTGWDGHFLTDSGGYQVMSLPCRLDDDGVTFRSSYDGSWQRLTPEGAVAVQESLGADIQMALDVCLALPAPRDAIELAGKRTLAWAERCLHARSRPGQLLFGIVQGGTELDLRACYAEQLAELGFDGYGIGGLSVGESREEMLASVAAAISNLPEDRPRYLMGVGDPSSLLAAVQLGVDMFDCVLPARLGRHGGALTDAGKLSVKAARYAKDERPLDPGCTCAVCAQHSRAYIRHLFNVGEPSAGRLVSFHNLAWLLGLLRLARQAVADGTLGELRRKVDATWSGFGQGLSTGRQHRPRAADRRRATA